MWLQLGEKNKEYSAVTEEESELFQKLLESDDDQDHGDAPIDENKDATG